MYDAWWLKTPLWTESTLPRLGCQLTSENRENLKELIDTCLTDPRYAEGRRQAKAETWEYPGEGAQRTVDYLLQKYEELTAGEEER